MPTPPTLNSLDPQTTHPGHVLTFVAAVTNPDSVPVNFSIIDTATPPNFPNAFIDAQGRFTWAVHPNTSTTGGAKILTLQITYNGGTDSEQCPVTVANEPPVLEALQPRTVHPGGTVRFAALASDLDGDAITYSMASNNELPGAFINPRTGEFTWQCPPNTTTPRNIVLTLYATDSCGRVSQPGTCAIAVTNQPPQLAPVQAQTVHPGRTLTFAASATDTDGDPVTYSLDVNQNYPNATIHPRTGEFTWVCPLNTPPQTVVPFTLRATDTCNASVTTTCQVTIVNQPPSLTIPQALTVQRGQVLTFTATATDAEDDPLTYAIASAQNMPGAFIIPQTGAFTWACPPNAITGGRALSIRVTDVCGGSDTKNCTVTVQ